MNLKQFRVTNYRSIKDSGFIDVDKQTVLVGRNESGKTNVLLALLSLNPPDGRKELSYVKDFPRERSRAEFSEKSTVVETVWNITDSEKKELVSIYPEINNLKHIGISRDYKGTLSVDLVGTEIQDISTESLLKCIGKIDSAIRASIKEMEGERSKVFQNKVIEFHKKVIIRYPAYLDIASGIIDTVNKFKNDLKALSFTIPPVAESNLTEILQKANALKLEIEQGNKVRQWIIDSLPVFIYLSDYPELEGSQDIPAFITRKNRNSITEADLNFENLCKVAGLDPSELNNLLSEDYEIRQQLANRAGAIVTKKIRELWTDRELKIRFNLDAGHFDTLVSDPTNVYDVEINLNERSRGFKWFFSFYITFTADTANGPAENAILLLDEPGLYLHAVAQRNLIDHLVNDFKNQVIYTTHSPFMIPIERLSTVRTINIDTESGTTVTNDPTGDERTLFPLQTALGYDLTQTLFIGDKNLVVEGVSDFWYLTAVSDYLEDLSRISLNSVLIITPAGGAHKVPYMVALLSSQKLKVLVLLDSERQGQLAASELKKSKLMREENITFISEGLGDKSLEADIEDLIEPSVFDELVKEAYSKELTNKKLDLNLKMPRIVKRYKDAFHMLDLEFNKTRPAKLFLKKIVECPEAVMPDSSIAKFELLFKSVNQKLAALIANPKQPFR